MKCEESFEVLKQPRWCRLAGYVNVEYAVLASDARQFMFRLMSVNNDVRSYELCCVAMTKTRLPYDEEFEKLASAVV